MGVHRADSGDGADGKVDIAKVRHLARFGYRDYTPITEMLDMRPAGTSEVTLREMSGASFGDLTMRQSEPLHGHGFMEADLLWLLAGLTVASSKCRRTSIRTTARATTYHRGKPRADSARDSRTRVQC